MFDFKREITELIREKIYSHLNVNRRTNQSDKINCRCFICGDSKKDSSVKRGWIHFNAGDVPSYYCFNEGCTAHGTTLLAKIQGITNKEAFTQVVQRFREGGGQNMDFSDSGGFFIDDENFEEFKPEPQKREDFIIPEDWMELDERAKNIIASRKIMEAPFAPKNWKLYLSAKYTRIVIPWLKDGKIISYQLRAIYKTQTPKYKFEKDIEKGIFITDNFDETFPYIFVGEGIFDMIFVQNGCAVGGIKPTNNQLEILKNKFPFHEIIIMLDNPWVDSASKKEIYKIYEKTSKQKVFMWDKNNSCKDINEDVVKINNLTKYDKDYLISRIMTVAKAKIMLKFGKSTQ